MGVILVHKCQVKWCKLNYCTVSIGPVSQKDPAPVNCHVSYTFTMKCQGHITYGKTFDEGNIDKLTLRKVCWIKILMKLAGTSLGFEFIWLKI